MGGRGSASSGGKGASKAGGVKEFTDDVQRDWITELNFAANVRSGKNPEVERGMEAFIASSGGVSGNLYRGIELKTDADLEQFKVGATLDMKGISSWTTDRGVALDYSVMFERDVPTVVFRTSGTKMGAKLSLSGEGEVIISKKARYAVAGIQDEGDRMYTVTLKELN